MAFAADNQTTTPTETLIVSARQTVPSELDTPAAIGVVDGSDLRQATPRVNLSEGLNAIPGLQIQNRQNYAQDLQLSVRGFGARSTFGVRGVRIYVDGIPSTMPDGQGQTSNIDLNSVDNVTVLRGPFSALYGNAAGGVVNINSQQGSQPATLEYGSWYGSYGSWRNSIKASGAVGDGSHPGDVNYLVSASRFTSHGWREHSAAQKNLANAQLGVRIDERSSLTLLFNCVDITAQDPGGLTAEQWQQNPRQVAAIVTQYNTRKTVSQSQAGLRYLREITPQDDLSLMLYAGIRQTTQYQSIPYSTQLKSDNHPGGVIDLTRHYQGVDSRWTHRDNVAGIPLTLTGGLDYETLSERRKGYENFIASSAGYTYGEKGHLRRNERNLVWNIDPYLQSSWQLTERLSLDAGLRYSMVNFDDNDDYITDGNGDDSYSNHFYQWLPAGALKYALTRSWNIYASAGRGMETPTLNERSYRSSGGNNAGLKPATSNSYELGSKARIGFGLLSMALFATDSQNEIVADSSSDGRTSYKNAGKTQRRGLELGFDQQFAYDWRLKMAWTLLDARYRSNVCGTADCNGHRIPGIARNMGYLSVGYQPETGWYAAGDLHYMSNIAADDENSVIAPAYTVAGIDSGYKIRHGDWQLDLFGRIDNLFDRHYIGSVIVNESNGRYYESAPGRNYSVGATLSYAFN
ncbi:TonB-dependent receptor [Erwinia sp. OLTSP20]|uniref:TonB-dependent receptor PqqU n=1 Tax=unclassified Erwinia TaxID=2622719 RepID=UPI000C18B911|nr:MULTISPECIES: TonB-dependent receptor PqqU [unclassified Erwinia]PIJ51737.1 TonB-dependent siderophore receptor [Erwinia sp. OAMSP11]PIJ75623.1 TonB-dependent receptor [Erwinia sp. OLSSP12]PIJ84928.1 TonB-dependent receptor [Erwinia sp. OLCASP19]PIJ86708.1 TonB-dependent receptor [Erwinia sp. OLMTSP26]PIJ88149.1 TonB-dependent receptor [Erwinia sp. OLMDSP33]